MDIKTILNNPSPSPPPGTLKKSTKEREGINFSSTSGSMLETSGSLESGPSAQSRLLGEYPEYSEELHDTLTDSDQSPAKVIVQGPGKFSDSSAIPKHLQQVPVSEPNLLLHQDRQGSHLLLPESPTLSNTETHVQTIGTSSLPKTSLSVSLRSRKKPRQDKPYGSNGDQKKWTEQEDEMLKTGINAGENWKTISQRFSNRTSWSCKKRFYNNLSNNPDFVKSLNKDQQILRLRKRNAPKSGVACISCHQRKIKCELKEQGCGKCEKLGINCVYPQKKPRSNNKGKSSGSSVPTKK